MIGHQTVPLNSHPKLLRLLSQNLKIRATVIINEKYILTIVPALGHMMGAIRYDDSRYSWHNRKSYSQHITKARIIEQLENN
jgi:2-polyprenyl-3-methyl-5-hydroxy-6-metoxy-1,4-benzoquinol methylase